MSPLMLIGIISTVGLLIFIGIGVFYYIRGKRHNMDNPMDFAVNPSTFRKQIDAISQKIYVQAIRIPLIKSFVGFIRRRLESMAIYDEYSLRRQIMFMVYKIVALVLSFVVVIIAFKPSWLIVFWCFLGALFIASLMVDFLIYRVEIRLLTQLREFNNRIRTFYHEKRMVEDAVYAALPYAGPEMKVQSERIYDILMSEDPESELEMYERVAPSRYLKGVAGLLIQIRDQGDKITKTGSSFTNSLSSINEEINVEITHRSKLVYQMKGYPALAIFPVFVTEPFEQWATKYFPVTTTFYDSQIGFIVSVFVYTISVVMYLVFRKMAEFREAGYRSKLKSVKWEEWLIEKIKPIGWFISSLTPAPHTKTHFVLSKLIKDANSPLKMESLTLHRVLTSLIVFLVLVVGLTFSHNREKQAVLYSTVPLSMYASNISDADYEAFTATTSFDREIILNVSQMQGFKPEHLEDYVAAQLGVADVSEPHNKETYLRIQKKYQKYANAYTKWYEVLLVLFVAIGSWFVPVWYLHFQRKLRFKAMENEVHQFLVWISILKQFDRMSVYTILVWLERMGVVFKDPIRDTLQEFDAGPEVALERLEESANFEGFNQIVARLKLSLTRVSIQQAFDDIEMERAYYLEQRQENYRRSLASKEMWSDLLCFVPVLSLSVLYFAFPILYFGVMDTHEIFRIVGDI